MPCVVLQDGHPAVALPDFQIVAVEQFGGLLFSLIVIRAIQLVHADDMALIVEDVSAVVHDIRSKTGTIIPGVGPLKVKSDHCEIQNRQLRSEAGLYPFGMSAAKRPQPWARG